jgi:Holliday junction resolvase RusA-like endonuclease
MNSVTIYNVIIPSINQKYIINKKTGQLVLSGAYRKFKEDLSLLFSKIEPVPPPYRINVLVRTYKDIDNFVKVMLDSLEAAGAIKNDRDVVLLNIRKFPAKRGASEAFAVEVLTDDEKDEDGAGDDL